MTKSGVLALLPLFWWILAALFALTVWHVSRFSNELSEVPAAGLPHSSVRRLVVPAESPILRGLVTADVQGSIAATSARGPLRLSAQGPLDAYVAAGPARAGEAGQASGSGDQGDSDDGPDGDAADAGLGNEAACNDVHPNADDPEMLHVVYASDLSQVEGVQASVASVVTTAATPEAVTVHIMVQARWAKDFKAAFGLRQNCRGAVTVSGVLILVHEVQAEQIERSVAKVSKDVKKQRGALDTLENFARFYMHLVLGPAVGRSIVIYLDADTIVQADLGQLRRQLLSSNKTVGFVARRDKVYMDKFLKKPKNCDLKGLAPKWSSMMKKPSYNVGVFVVDLHRWVQSGAVQRVEQLVSLHNECGGSLWVGGSQPPLLLAFHNYPESTPEDFVVLDAAWNAGDLGWRTNLNRTKLKSMYVLHWNGNKKPWNADGLYKDFWKQHRERFGSLLQPFEGQEASEAAGAGRTGAAGASASASSSAATAPAASSSGRRRRRSTTTLSPQEAAAKSACPYVDELAEWTKGGGIPCALGKTFGCSDDGKNMWVKTGCSGLFLVHNKVTACSSEERSSKPVACAASTLPSASANCGLMVMTTFFTTKQDWQRGHFAKATFEKIRKLYASAIRWGVPITLVYDDLPEDLLSTYSNKLFSFHKVSLSDYDKRYGVNDVRYFFFKRLVEANPQWTNVFVVDAFDVRVGMNPCADIKPDKLYVGVEMDILKNHPWMKARFHKMGGKYKTWYDSKVDGRMKILNCGLTGGNRALVLKLFSRMIDVLKDPDLAPNKKGEDVNVNMAALNYIVYNEFSKVFTGNAPFHSLYKRFQNRRQDVWFIHK